MRYRWRLAADWDAATPRTASPWRRPAIYLSPRSDTSMRGFCSSILFFSTGQEGSPSCLEVRVGHRLGPCRLNSTHARNGTSTRRRREEETMRRQRHIEQMRGELESGVVI